MLFPVAVAGMDPLAPRPTRGFLEYSQERGCLIDPARAQPQGQMQQFGHQAVAHPMARAGQRLRQLSGALAGPAQERQRVAAGLPIASYRPAKRRVLPDVEHRRHKGLNNRAENSHRPTRRRERGMQRFKSPEQATALQSKILLASTVTLRSASHSAASK